LYSESADISIANPRPQYQFQGLLVRWEQFSEVRGN
jgi:hypothetical protein